MSAWRRKARTWRVSSISLLACGGHASARLCCRVERRIPAPMEGGSLPHDGTSRSCNGNRSSSEQQGTRSVGFTDGRSGARRPRRLRDGSGFRCPLAAPQKAAAASEVPGRLLPFARPAPAHRRLPLAGFSRVFGFVIHRRRLEPVVRVLSALFTRLSRRSLQLCGRGRPAVPWHRNPPRQEQRDRESGI